MYVDPDSLRRPLPSFGAWLLKQNVGVIGELAEAAKKDVRFPKEGTPDDVRARMTAVMADSDMWEALEDAERAWAASS